jgi:hypothetical protein
VAVHNFHRCCLTKVFILRSVGISFCSFIIPISCCLVGKTKSGWTIVSEISSILEIGLHLPFSQEVPCPPTIMLELMKGEAFDQKIVRL